MRGSRRRARPRSASASPCRRARDAAPPCRSFPAGAENCGCCAGVAPSTPRRVENRHGLTAIAYRVGDYARFRDSLHARLSSAQAGKLQELLTREPDDFTLGLVDAFACAADVLTFYSERIANESYLATATERVSLQEMGRLIGYRLRPGVAVADANTAARASLEASGWIDAFTTGLGHGVGLQIHEDPFIGSAHPGRLVSRTVLTMEPGIYLPGRGGVRIEDTVLVTDPDHGGEPDVLTDLTKELLEID